GFAESWIELEERAEAGLGGLVAADDHLRAPGKEEDVGGDRLAGRVLRLAAAVLAGVVLRRRHHQALAPGGTGLRRERIAILGALRAADHVRRAVGAEVEYLGAAVLAARPAPGSDERRVVDRVLRERSRGREREEDEQAFHRRNHIRGTAPAIAAPRLS